MFTYGQPYQLHQAAAPAVSSGSHLRSTDVTLVLRQQPREALVTADGKEKARKPVDPPPIIQLNVKPGAEANQHFLQSPYLFMCTSLYKESKDEAGDAATQNLLAGSLVSSLHRLKDIDNKDGGFFVFGDISVRKEGTYRLHFSLFDLQKDTNEVQYLGCITTDPFKVLAAKDFKGMDESTYLSRAFSDQGVRLRLRKEPRAMMGNKRPFPYGTESPGQSNSLHTNRGDYSYEDSTPQKRIRTENEFKREPYPDHSATAYTTAYNTPVTYGSRHSNLSGMHSSIASYPTFAGPVTTSATTGFQIRGAPTSGYLADNLLPSSSGTVPNSLGALHDRTRYNNLSNPSYGMFPFNTQTVSGTDFDPRSVTATGMSPSMPLPQTTPQSQHSAHQSQDALNASRGGSYSHSPELVRNSGFPDHYTNMGTNLSDSGRPNRYGDPSQLTHNLYPHHSQRNPLPALPAESNLTSHTDTGTLPPSHTFNPDLNSTEEHGLDSR